MALILKKRQTRQTLFALGGAVLLVSFQNCAPPTGNDLCPKGQVCDGSSLDSSAGGKGTSGGNGSGSGSSGSSGSSGAGWGSGSANNNGSSGGNGTGIDAGAGGGSSPIPGDGGSAPPTGGSSYGLQFYKDLDTSLTVNEGSGFNFSVTMAGGKQPYTFVWYLNGTKIVDNSIGTDYPNYSGLADRFSKEGAYEVEVTDANGTKIRSRKLNLTISEATGGCVSGAYAMMSGNDTKTGLALHEIFENSRGKYLIAMSNPNINFMSSNPGYWNLNLYSYQVANYMDKRTVACTTAIPRGVNTLPAGYSAATYTVSGAITVECHNSKWKVLTNTCKFTKKSGTLGN